MSHHQNIASGVKSPAAQVSLNPAFTEATDGKNKKALKALLSELEQLLATFSEAASGDKGSSTSKKGDLLSLLQSDPVKFADLIKQAGKGSLSKTDFQDVLHAISAQVASTKGYDNEKVSVMLQELYKGTPEEEKSNAYQTYALGMMKEVSEGLDSGETSLGELFSSPEISAFVGEIFNPEHATTAGNVKVALSAVLEGKDGDDEFIGRVLDIHLDASVDKTANGKEVLATLTCSKKLAAVYKSGNTKAALDGLATKVSPKKDDSYVQAMMKIAVSLAGLLANIYDAQNATNDINLKISQKQASNSESLAKNNILGVQQSITAQAAASKKPWVMYLVAAVLAIAGAIATFFTAGAAGAAVALAVGAVMASPAGDKITGGLAEACGGGTGGQAGAAAITTAVTTILSLGAGGFASAADVAIDELADDVVAVIDEAVSATGNAAGTATGTAADTATATAEQLSAVGEETGTQTAVGTAEKAGTKSSKLLAKFAKKIKEGFSQKWSKEAFEKGILKRAVGTYLSGFVGNNGVTDLIEAACPESTKSTAGAIIVALTGAVVAICGTLGFAQITKAGFKVRAKFLEEAKLQNVVFKFTKPIEIAVRIMQAAGTATQGGVSLSKASQEMQVAVLQQNNARTSSQVTSQKYNQQSANELQQHTSKSYNTMIESLNDTLNQSLESIGGEEQNAKRAASR